MRKIYPIKPLRQYSSVENLKKVLSRVALYIEVESLLYQIYLNYLLNIYLVFSLIVERFWRNLFICYYQAYSFFLLCLDVFHKECLNDWASQLPPHTAPAGYKCPVCFKPVFPAANLVSPVADHLRENLAVFPWARTGLDLPLVFLFPFYMCIIFFLSGVLYILFPNMCT